MRWSIARSSAPLRAISPQVAGGSPQGKTSVGGSARSGLDEERSDEEGLRSTRGKKIPPR
jgi:hypothetical protein